MELRQYSVKGKDLPGAVKVTPEGLKEVIAKREFIELGKEGSNILDSVIQNPTNNFDNIYEKQNPWCQKSRTDINGASKNYSFSAPKPFNHSEKKTSITIDHRKEICQESLKSTIQSAISDIEVNLNLNSAKVYEAHLLDEPKIPELAPIILYSDDLNDLNAHEINNAELVSSIAESIEHLKESKNELRSEDNKLNTEICSLKRRNPREMYTDSSFYNPKHHPSVAEQFEMAHRLSSSLYDDVNKKSTGQKMFLKRAKKSGHWIYSDDLKEDKDCLNVQDIQLSHENKVLNLKLVMNPDGKLYDWTNIQEGILPPMNPLTPEMALNVVKNLEDCKGKGGELFAKRRKRAEKWVIDETSIGKAGHPGEVAQNFFQNSQEEKVIEKNICQLKERIKGQCKLESHQLTDEIQKFFQEEQKYKQEKVFEMRQNQQMSKHDLSQENNSSNLPSNNLLQVNNWTVHNKQGINVWASSIPESWSKFTTKQLNNSISNIMRNTREYDTDKTIMNSDLKNNGHVSIDVSTAATTKKTETNDLEKKKKKEYERWFKDQEKLQQVVEYDCFVEYVEKIDSNSFVSDGIIGNMNKDEVNFILFQIPEKEIDISITNGKIYNNEIQEYNEKKEQIIEKVEHQHKRSVQEHIIGGGSNKLKCNKHSPNSEDFQKMPTIVKQVDENIVNHLIECVAIPNVNEKGSDMDEKKIPPHQNLELNYEKYSVKNLVDRFSKSTPPVLPLQYLPQQYLTSNENPPLNYLIQPQGDQKINELTPKEPKNKIQTLCKDTEEDLNKLNRFQNSVEEFLLMNVSNCEGHISTTMTDPSYLLAVKEIPNEYFGYNTIVQGDESISLMSLAKSKWDNHNTIARGWKSVSSNYAPVTFRKKYNVETQKL